MEIFKSIRGFKYRVSNYGRVEINPNKITYGYLNRDGYRYITAKSHIGTRHTLLVHRLVAKAFIANSKSKPCINHRDGNKENNHVDNLEWVTHSENMKHAVAFGLSTNAF